MDEYFYAILAFSFISLLCDRNIEHTEVNEHVLPFTVNLISEKI